MLDERAFANAAMLTFLLLVAGCAGPSVPGSGAAAPDTTTHPVFGTPSNSVATASNTFVPSPSGTGAENLSGVIEGPHASDPAGDSLGGPWSDMLDAWFSIENGELVANWKVAELRSLDDLPPPRAGDVAGACWNLDFWVNDEYWALWAPVVQGSLVVTQRRPQYLLNNGQPHVSTGTHPIEDGKMPAEIEYGAPATIKVRYDGGAYPLRAGDKVQWATVNAAHSCYGGPNKRMDGFTLADPFILPVATARPPPTHFVYEALGTENGPWEIRKEDRGSAYDFSSVPPIIVTSTLASSNVRFHFYNASGFQVTGEPGGIPWRATHFEYYYSVPPVATWSIKAR